MNFIIGFCNDLNGMVELRQLWKLLLRQFSKIFVSLAKRLYYQVAFFKPINFVHVKIKVAGRKRRIWIRRFFRHCVPNKLRDNLNTVRVLNALQVWLAKPANCRGRIKLVDFRTRARFLHVANRDAATVRASEILSAALNVLHDRKSFSAVRKKRLVL